MSKEIEITKIPVLSARVAYKAGYKYQIVEDFYVLTNICPPEDIHTKYTSLYKSGLLHIKPGWASDGPSGPTVDTKDFMRGAFIHDAGYEMMRLGLLGPEWREPFDQELIRFCKMDGMSKWRRWRVKVGVRKFAAYAADPKNKKKVLYAP